MTTLAANKPRKMEIGDRNEFPVVASDIIYAGAAVSLNSGNAQPLVGAQPFAGFAEAKADNSTGAAGDVKVRVIERGKIEVPVVGATGITNVGASVYASDDDTFTLTSTSNALIGTVARHVSGTTCVVAYKAAHLPD